MTEPMSDEELALFLEYASENDTESDGTQCQWASYTIRCIDEIHRLRVDLAVLQNVEVKLMEAEAEVERLNNEVAATKKKWAVGVKAAFQLCTGEIEELRAEVERLEKENHAHMEQGTWADKRFKWYRDKLKDHEEAMEKVHGMMKRQRDLNQEQMEEIIEPSPEEKILRAKLEEK